MAVPVTTYLNYARICQYLASNGNSQQLLIQGGGNRPKQNILLYIFRNIIQWQNNLNPNDPDLPKLANYMFSLCNPYLHDAINIINSGTTGNIVNPSTGGNVTIATPLVQFRVGDVGAPMTAGQTSLTLNYTGVVSASVEITLDGTEIPYGSNISQQEYTVTYNTNNIVIIFSNGVVNSELYMIHFIQLVNV